MWRKSIKICISPFQTEFVGLPMPCRVDEVEATVDSVINNMASVESALILQITLELLVDISDDALETVCVVNGVPIARSVHDSEAHLNAPLLYFYAAHINLHCLLQVLCEGTGNEGKGKISNFQYVFSIEVYRSSASGSASADIRMNFDIRIRIRIRNISCGCHADIANNKRIIFWYSKIKYL